MDDSCAVCADSLEWVAYGSCGHREVCSTCVVRLRVVLGDRCCCICKTESPTVFVTKAMGDYTRVITDFSAFSAGAKEGHVGSYWYHEGSQAYFDDVDHYRMIKAICRLSCSLCDKSVEEQGNESTKRKSKFRHIEQLKGHLYHLHRMVMCSLCLEGRKVFICEQGNESTKRKSKFRHIEQGNESTKRKSKFRHIEQLKGHLYHLHRMVMCSLCLEGRKVFICEQKLYTQKQLQQHIRTGDFEVDGSESERGGFMGHPMCEFCRNPYYGDNELYMHMSTEHYTCHMCQRQHLGQYDYYRNYDDLETHFRHEHFLCEDEACLAKKFVVFQTEAEMKRHNTIEHGGHMSRSKRNAALQIPTSFRYRRGNDQDQRRGRGRGFHPDPSNNQLSEAIQASMETAFADIRARESSVQPVIDLGETQADRVTGCRESFPVNLGSDAPPRSSAAAPQSSRNAHILEESYFPPLSDREPPEPSSRYAQALNHGSAARLTEELFPPLPGASSKPRQGVEGLGNSTLASRLNRKKGTMKVHKSAQPRSSETNNLGPSSSVSFPELRPIQNQGHAATTSSSSKPQARESQVNRDPISVRENGFVSPVSANPAWSSSSGNRMEHSSSASSFVDAPRQPIANAVSVATRKQVLPSSEQSLPIAQDVHTANKSLVERIRIGLGNDEERYAAFKSISTEYRQGQINTWEYISYVEQFGLMHLVVELSRLCPDPQKQKELIDAYNANFWNQGLQENGATDAGSSKESKQRKKKGKGKGIDRIDDVSGKVELANNFLNTVRKLQLNQKHQEGEVEVLSMDGYRTDKSVSNSASASMNLAGSSRGELLVNSTSSSQNLAAAAAAGGKNGKRKGKLPRFNRNRLGDDLPANTGCANAIPERKSGESSDKLSGTGPVQGVWKNNGGQQLFPKPK